MTQAIEINTYRPNQTVIANTGSYYKIQFGFMLVGLARAESEQEALEAFRALPGSQAYASVQAERLPGNVAAIMIEDGWHKDWLNTASESERASDYARLQNSPDNS